MKGMMIAMALLVLASAGGFSKEKSAVSEPKKVGVFSDFVKKVYLSTNETESWIIKVDDTVLSQKDLEVGYQLFLNQLPDKDKSVSGDPTVKKQFLKNLILQDVVVLEAMQDGFFESEEDMAILKSVIRQAIYQLYLNRIIPKDQLQFMPSREEVNSYYELNKDRYAQMGLSADQIRQYIASELSQKKLQLWVTDYLDKAKEKYRIKRNAEVLKKQGLD